MTEKDNTRSKRVQIGNTRHEPIRQEVENAKRQVRDSNEDELEKED